ncbi:MAG: 2-dehydropantoate 2-reductase [Microvirga sp.]
MRVLVVGAGALGGYFGGRLLAAGRDVTFLVRQRRAEELARDGLRIESRFGDLHLGTPPTVLAQDLRQPFDLVLLSCKAYDLEAAMDAFAPAVGAGTAILPLLNGMAHLDALEARFSADAVLGGVALIGATLHDGTVVHLNDVHGLVFGDRAGGIPARIAAVAAVMDGAGFDARASDAILVEMWEKWVMLASLAAGTCLMRAPVGAIVAAPGGRELMLGLHEEATAVAKAAGREPRAPAVERTRAMLTTPKSPFSASMLRDLEGGGRTEADHVIGDLVRRGEAAGLPCRLLRLAYTHLKAYEARRATA